MGQGVDHRRLTEPTSEARDRMTDTGRVKFPAALEMTDCEGTRVAEVTVRWVVCRNGSTPTS